MVGDDGIRRDWLEKDFYKELGVPKKAGAAEIKKAYRKLARELHPDANPDNHKAEEKFKAVSEAYDVLGDSAQRTKYDEARELYGSGGGTRFGAPGFGGGGQGGAQNFTNADFSDLFSRGNAGAGGGGFSDVFSGLFNRGGRAGSASAPRHRRGADIESEVTLSFNDALDGVTLPLRLSSDGPCQTCRGTGAKPGSNPRTCPACQGTGAIVRNQGGFAFSEPCDQCHGRGALIDDPCPNCRGSGHALSTRSVNARIPGGVKDRQKIRLKGKGAPGENGGSSGDLFLLVHVSSHPVFGRGDGANVTLSLPVAFDELALGAHVKVPTPAGSSVTLNIPAGTTNGRKFRVKGHGAVIHGGSRGDLMVTVHVVVPKHLSDAEKSAIEAYRSARADYDPRSGLMAKLGETR